MKSMKLIVAVAVSFVFMIFWDMFVASRYRSPAPQKETVSSAKTPSEAPASVSSLQTPPPAAVPQPKGLGTVTLKTGDVEVTMESQGARVTSWKIREKEHWVDLIKPVPGAPLPLETMPDQNFSVQKTSDREAVFSAVLPNGCQFTKTLTLLRTPPFHSISYSLFNKGASNATVETALVWGPGLNKKIVNGKISKKEEQNVLAEMKAVAFSDRLRSWRTGMFSRELNVADAGSYEWAGVSNNHFIAVFLPLQGTISNIHIRADKTTPAIVSIPWTVTLKPGDTVTDVYRLYVGPKSYDLLTTLNYNLNRAVDFGFFGVIAKGLFKTLQFLQNLTGNYGWAIVLMTILIQLLVFPLTRKSFHHSLRLKELQPQINKMREQFKSDPKRLQIETLNLYRKNGLKFMGMEGCFPMLLQLPIFFSFYSTLNVAYDLRGAPWIFWVKDLASHDPYYILPILMGAGMFLQQKTTSVAADPAQAKMMMFMPVIFTFMFLALPAGLVLYWTVNSAMTIVIQKIMMLRSQHAPPSTA